MSAPAYRRVRDWYVGTVLARAATARQVDGGAFVARDPRWPHSYANNALVATEDLGAKRLDALADEMLEGLDHRQVLAYCPLSSSTLTGLVELGYELQPEVFMACRPDPPSGLPPGIESIATAAEEMAAFQSRLWREEWLPGASDDVVEQLVARRAVYDHAGTMDSLVVRVDDGVVACVDLASRDGVTELDGLATLASYRSRGLAGALVEAAHRVAADRGSDLLVLTALTDDWPREWYARVGFQELGPATEASRPAAMVRG